MAPHPTAARIDVSASGTKRQDDLVYYQIRPRDPSEHALEVLPSDRLKAIKAEAMIHGVDVCRARGKCVSFSFPLLSVESCMISDPGDLVYMANCILSAVFSAEACSFIPLDAL